MNKINLATLSRKVKKLAAFVLKAMLKLNQSDIIQSMTNKTVLLFGGRSGERLVSVASAQNLAESFNFDEILFLDAKGSLFLVDQNDLLSHKDPFLNEFKSKTKLLYTSLIEAQNFFADKVTFLALHGTEGEDGEIQSFFENSQNFFTGSGARSSQNSFDKKISKKIVSAAKIKTTDEFVFTMSDIHNTKSAIESFFDKHQKIVLKPVANGSSIGLHIVDHPKALMQALDKIKECNLGDYIAEKFIVGRELSVGIFDSPKGLKTLPPSEIVMQDGRAFDYDGKYLGQGSAEITPADLNAKEIEAAQKMALEAHIALNCYGYSRTDLILTADGPVYLETNTLPGLSKPSLLPQQLNVADIRMNQFIQQQIELALKRRI
jgi:D-alanine-D-alanine ligase